VRLIDNAILTADPRETGGAPDHPLLERTPETCNA
jgi:hypothetical protein